MINIIALSVGHNDKAKGASYMGFTEYHEAEVWVDLIKSYLQNDHYYSVIVPKGKLRDKVKWINNYKHKVAMAIEIHFNGSVNPFIKGCETLHCPRSDKGKKLASYIQGDLSKTMGVKNRGVKEGWYKMKKGGTPDYFLKATSCPAIIIEPDFISQIANITSKRKRACKSIARSIIEYMQNEIKNV